MHSSRKNSLSPALLMSHQQAITFSKKTKTKSCSSPTQDIRGRGKRLKKKKEKKRRGIHPPAINRETRSAICRCFSTRVPASSRGAASTEKKAILPGGQLKLSDRHKSIPLLRLPFFSIYLSPRIFTRRGRIGKGRGMISRKVRVTRPPRAGFESADFERKIREPTRGLRAAAAATARPECLNIDALNFHCSILIFLAGVFQFFSFVFVSDS